jgi:site-specific recombinase XerD
MQTVSLRTGQMRMTDFERLMDRISIRTLAAGLRDRAIIALLLTHSAARVEDIIKMRVQDYYRTGDRRWVRLLANGVERLEPLEGKLEAYLDEYLAVVRIDDDPSSPLFRRLLDNGKVTSRRLSAAYVSRMIRRRVTSTRRSEAGSRASGRLPRRNLTP